MVQTTSTRDRRFQRGTISDREDLSSLSAKSPIPAIARTNKITLAEFWLGLIDTASNIRLIAERAIEQKARVRWFDFERFAQTRVARGGVRRFLVPLNAVE